MENSLIFSVCPLDCSWWVGGYDDGIGIQNDYGLSVVGISKSTLRLLESDANGTDGWAYYEVNKTDTTYGYLIQMHSYFHRKLIQLNNLIKINMVIHSRL